MQSLSGSIGILIDSDLPTILNIITAYRMIIINKNRLTKTNSESGFVSFRFCERQLRNENSLKTRASNTI
jgi:hypothetical protein